MILEVTLAGPFETASNVRRPVTESGWVLLLPTLAWRRVLVIGDPGTEVLHSLRLFAEEVTVVRSPDALPSEWTGSSPPPVDVVVHADPAVVAHPAIGDLRPAVATWWRAGRAGVPEPRCWLVPQGPADPPAAVAGPIGLPFGATPSRPRLGELERLRTRAEAVLDRARRQVLTRVASRRSSLPGATGRPDRRRRAGDPDREGSTLTLSASSGAQPTEAVLELTDPAELGAIPQWVRSTAAAHGVELGGRRWSVNLDADYRSQKVLFRVFGPDADLIVKVTRDPAFSGRLHNEHRGLVHLEGLAIGRHAPQALFDGEYCGLAVVGETALDGRPFSSATDLSPGCRHLHRALEWAVALGSEPSLRASVDRSRAEAACQRLATIFARLCAPSEDVRSMLDRDIERLLDSSPVPTVFMHGDLGTWNLLVDDDDQIGVLDWENADPAGLPSWDVSHLVMSHAQRAAIARGQRFTAGTVRSMFAPGTPWLELFDRSCHQAMQHVDADPALAGPLVRLSWAHLAVKAATRRPAKDSGGSLHAKLLRLVAERAPTRSAFW